jgi:membrane protein YdbS with pleckstrin-like domain
MALDIIPLIPLERGQLHVLRIRALSGVVWMLAIAAVAVLLPYYVPEALEILPEWVGPWRWVALILVPLALWKLLVVPGREWRRCGYAFTGRELHIAAGWWTRIHAIVPVSRVQHIDVVQGPVERMFGVARLLLFTAGTDMAAVPLGGIRRETAEEIRDAIRVSIGSAE